MKLNKLIMTTVVATTLMLSSSTVAFAGGGQHDGELNTHEETSIQVTEQNEDIPLTPDGNLSMVDDVVVTDETHKQFIIAQSKNGNYFYIVIDRTKDSENVYLLNMVDEADLVALANGETVPLDPTTTTKPVEPELPTDDIETEPVEEKTNSGVLIIVLVLGLGGLGGAYYFFFMKDKNIKPDISSDIDFSDDEDDRYTTDDAFGSETESDDDDYYDDNDTEVV